MSTPPLSIDEFVFVSPLYRKFPCDDATLQPFYGFGKKKTADGFCRDCQRETTFSIRSASLGKHSWTAGDARTLRDRDSLTLKCVRDDDHQVIVYFEVKAGEIWKIGQSPSLADIANDEVRQFRKVMTAVDGAELHKAIGLAAHGVGVGSFVYLRRVFERLIWQRFQDFKELENWQDDEFLKLRMPDKIIHLKNHLPDFLISNAGIYAILSKGIHELDEQDCLRYFEILKQSVIVILEEDQKNRKDLERKEILQKELAKIKGA